jgi:predicted alpha/beta-fold hydrolase
VDLQLCTDNLATTWGGFYDRHFARMLFHHVRETSHWSAAIPREWLVKRPKRLLEFDERFTAPLGGFRSAADYYHQCSAARVIERMNLPTLVLSSRDDPLIPVGILETQDWPDCVELHFAPGGGHLGYIGRSASGDPDRNWMDWRVIDWLTNE